jgi:hypothetical protein
MNGPRPPRETELERHEMRCWCQFIGHKYQYYKGEKYQVYYSRVKEGCLEASAEKALCVCVCVCVCVRACARACVCNVSRRQDWKHKDT